MRITLLSRTCLAVSGIVLLASCSTFEFRYDEDETEKLIREVMGPMPSSEQEVPPTLSLSDEAKAILDEKVDAGWSSPYKLNKLRDLLFEPTELGIRYDASSTRTAMEVWESGEGNCLSMTNLFVAAARHVGLDAGYETVDVTPTWDNSGATMVRYEHIIATGQLGGGSEYVMDFLPEFVIGDKASRRISDRDAVTLFYNNLGAEALVMGNPEEALAQLRNALWIDPEFSNGWTNIGAALRRLGKPKLAEFAWQRALDLDSHNLSAMSNLAQFYQSRGRDRDAEQLMRQVREYRARNPWFHFYLARLLFEEGEFRESEDFLRRSIRLKRDEPRFYEALAETYKQLGQEDRVERNLALADRYRNRTDFRPPERARQHRFFVQEIEVQ